MTQPKRRTILKGATAGAVALSAIPAEAAAQPAAEAAKGAIGTARPRLEGHGKVTGGVRYAADEKMPGLVHGVLVLSTVARGRILKIDTAAVLAMPGVLGVVDHTNAPRLNPQAGHFFGPDGQLQWLQSDEIHYSGQPIALVVAQTIEQAQAAAKALPGRLGNGNLAEYLVPVNADITDVDVHFLDYPDLIHNPVGARGVGEVGIVGVAAAVGNAIYNATGKRIRDLPITIEKLL